MFLTIANEETYSRHKRPSPVKLRYCRAPTIYLYYVELEHEALDTMINFDEEDEKGSSGLQ